MRYQCQRLAGNPADHSAQNLKTGGNHHQCGEHKTGDISACFATGGGEARTGCTAAPAPAPAADRAGAPSGCVDASANHSAQRCSRGGAGASARGGDTARSH